MLSMGTTMDAETIFDTYRNRLVRRQVSETALREYRLVTTAFVAWLKEAGKTMEDVRRPDIEDFMGQSGWSPRTQRSRLTYLRRPWAYAVEMELLERSPFNGMPVELAKPAIREPRIIPIEDLRAIKAGIRNHRDNAVFHVLAYTGFRISEVADLTWNDVSFGNQTIHTIGKGDRERTIPLHPALQEALRAYGVFGQGSMWVFPGQRGGRLAKSGIHLVIKRLVKPYDWSAHDFRRTFATSLTHNGVERAVIAQLLGHAADDIAGLHYIQFSQRRLFEEMLALYRADPL